jgi:hypothetical protein
MRPAPTLLREMRMMLHPGQLGSRVSPADAVTAGRARAARSRKMPDAGRFR